MSSYGNKIKQISHCQNSSKIH